MTAELVTTWAILELPSAHGQLRAAPVALVSAPATSVATDVVGQALTGVLASLLAVALLGSSQVQ